MTPLIASQAAVLGAAVAIDWLVGEPPSPAHPVVWMGRAIGWAEGRAPARGPLAQLIAGAVLAIAIPSACALAAWAGLRVVRGVLPAAWLAEAALLKTMFALCALGRAGDEVRRALARESLDDARHALRSLCSRDPSELGASEIAAAAVESIAENVSDSFVAPVFWFVLFGLPGAAFYRAVNTLDAMVGYRGRYEWLGKASARLDDALNWVPARATAWLLLASGALHGMNARRGAAVLERDGAKTASPNAGRPMAAMAGLLGVELAKRGHYRLGEGLRSAVPADVSRAWSIARAAALLATVAAVLALGARPLLSG